MNILFWVLQVVLALHTLMGAVWKFTNPEQTVPSLSAIPHAAWIGIAVLEIVVAIGLVAPGFYSPMASVIPIAALCLVVEMLVFSAVHVASSAEKTNGQMVYWLVVAALCAFVAYGRFSIRPL